jgi:hypothetical protein
MLGAAATGGPARNGTPFVREDVLAATPVTGSPQPPSGANASGGRIRRSAVRASLLRPAGRATPP